MYTPDANILNPRIDRSLLMAWAGAIAEAIGTERKIYEQKKQYQRDRDWKNLVRKI